MSKPGLQVSASLNACHWFNGVFLNSLRLKIGSMVSSKASASSRFSDGELDIDGAGDQDRMPRRISSKATTGRRLSEYLLGIVHEHGYLGVQANQETAIMHYKASADEGYPDAQFALGRLYLSQDQAQQNLAAAEYWLKTAASNGSAAAKAILTRLYFVSS